MVFNVYEPGSEGMVDINHHQPNGQISTEPSHVSLPLVMVPAPGYTKENTAVWVSSPDRLEPPPKPFHLSNCSDSPCVSDSGSDIFSKREVIQKLRQQLKKRDDMILEMHDQIMELQNSLSSQQSHSEHLRAQVDAANRDLFDSEREIQRLRKAIADHCVGQMNPNCLSEPRNGYHVNGDNAGLGSPEKGRGGGDGERVEMLKREVRELREVMEGKEYLLQSYKEQKVELSMKLKELQQRLDSQVPNIL